MTTLFRDELGAQFIQLISIVGRAMRLMADLLRQNQAPSEIVGWYAMGDARLVQAVAGAVFAVLLAALAVQLVLQGPAGLGVIDLVGH